MTRAQILNLALAGLLTGNELSTFAFAHPAASTLPHAAHRAFERTITRRMIGPMALLMVGTVGTGTAATRSAAAGRTLLGAGTACYATMLAVTLVGNMPLNVATLRADERTTPEAWNGIRRRWDRLHLVRNLLNVTGLCLLTAAAVHALPQPPKP